MRVLLAVCLWLLFPSGALAALCRVETPKFIFYGTSAKSLKEDALRLERYDAFLRRVLKISAPSNSTKLTVYKLASQGDVVKVSQDQRSDIAGFYEANEGGVIAVTSATGEDGWEDIVLFHEYAHHLMQQYSTAVYPAWYVEGYAELLSTVRFRGDRLQFGLPAHHRAVQLLDEPTLPIQTLLTASVEDLKRGQTGNFYGRAWLLTHYLSISSARPGQLTRYLQVLNEGTSSLEAARQAFGDLGVLHRDMEHYLRASTLKYLMLVWPPPSGIDPQVTVMPPAFGETILDRIRVRRGTLADEREGVAERLRKAAAVHASDAELWTLLAEAELDAEHDAAAIAAADKALALDPNMSRALLWRGLAMMHQLQAAKDDTSADWKAARSWIIRANRADTEDALTLFEYYRSFERAGEVAPPLAIEGLTKAAMLLPQAESFRLAYVFELAKQARYLDAVAALRPIANAPHGGGQAAYAQRLTRALREAAAAKPGTVDLSDIYGGLDLTVDTDPTAPEVCAPIHAR